MLKHTLTHRSSSSLSGCSSSQPASLPYELPSYQNESSFQQRRGSLSSSMKSQPPLSCYQRRPPESAHCSPLPSSKLQGDRKWRTSEATNLRKESIMSPLGQRHAPGSRSFVELINLLDAHPSLADIDPDDSCSEASFSSQDTSISTVGSQFGSTSSYPTKSHPGSHTAPVRSTTLPRNNEMPWKKPLSHSDSFSSIDSYSSCSSIHSSRTLINSRSPSASSLSETIAVKVYIRRLRPDMEYKTLPLSSATTCREMILSLLVKFRLRHRDPNLFFVMMEVTVRSTSDSAPTRRILVLDDNARPAELQQCRPAGEARFSIGVRRGGLIRVHDSILMPGSQYKSLILSYGTTSDELVQLLLKCYNNNENPKHFALHEVCKNPYADRSLRGDECPLMIQAGWPKLDRSNREFVLRRNIVYSFSLKSRMKWTNNNEKSNVIRETEVGDISQLSHLCTPSPSSTVPRNSCFSSSGSVSSNCSTSSDSSLDSGYLGSPLSSFKLTPSLGSVVVQKSQQSYVKPHQVLPMTQRTYASSVPLTQTLSRLTCSMEPKIKLNDVPPIPVKSTSQSKTQTVIKIIGSTKCPPSSQPISRRNIVAIKPITLKQLSEFSHTNKTDPLNVQANSTPREYIQKTSQGTSQEISTKPRIVGEIPKEPELSKLHRQLSECLQTSGQSLSADIHKKSFKLCPPPPPSSPRFIRTNYLINKKDNASFPSAERKFYDAVESLKSLGSTHIYKRNELKIVE